MTDAAPPERPPWHRLLRPETGVLLLGLGWTAAAKTWVVSHQTGGGAPSVLELSAALLPDLVFFAVIWLLFRFSLFVRVIAPVMMRSNLLLATVILAWSIMNAGWLLAEKVQLQPGVLGVLLGDLPEFWPIVSTHLLGRPVMAGALALCLAIGLGWIGFRLIRTTPLQLGKRDRAFIAALIGAILLMTLVNSTVATRGRRAYSGQVIGFSSHWYALETLFGRGDDELPDGEGRQVARRGERQIETPANDRRPNVIIVFLESVSYRASSLSPDGAATPVLERLAGEGVEFVTTRVPVAQTSKAFWAGLTGVTPDVSPDTIESVLVDTPYESLPTILARRGYRSAFFEMSKGSFECAPGQFHNMGFDWAWFRENLRDPGAHLGYMNGDDFRMIEPMMEWVEADDAPFLLTMITTVAHDPYVLPEWYEINGAQETEYDRYLRCVEFTDAFLGALDDELVARGLAENTLLCVMGDHGDGFRPESGRGRWVPFEEVIRVPWIVRFPGVVEAGTRVTTPSSQLDLTPTLLALLGHDVSAAAFDGVDARQLPESPRRFHFSSWYRSSPFGRVEGDIKYIYWPVTDSLFEYDLANDPGEESPQLITGGERDEIISDLLAWQSAARLELPARRYRESNLYGFWRAICSGRTARSYFVPGGVESE